jgi:hypothetical protein
MNEATQSSPPSNAQIRHDLIPRRRLRWLLALARIAYKTYLRANGWRRVLLPNPIRGGGFIVKWTATIGPRRYALLFEEALQCESNLHRSRLNQLAAGRGRKAP